MGFYLVEPAWLWYFPEERKRKETESSLLLIRWTERKKQTRQHRKMCSLIIKPACIVRVLWVLRVLSEYFVSIVGVEQTFERELRASAIVAIVDTREIDREVFVEVASSHSSSQTYIRFRRRLERNQ